MGGLWAVIMILTMLVIAIATIWVIAQAFAEHFLWGLAILFIPVVWIVFVALNWQKSGRPFLIGLAGTGALLVEALVAGGFQRVFG